MPTNAPPHEVYTILPYQFPWLLLVVAVIIVLVVIIAIIIYLQKRRRKDVSIPLPRDLVKEAKTRIINLKPPEHFPVGTVQQNYFFALGIAFRELIEYRFKVKAIGATLKEIKPRLQILPVSLTTIEHIVEFMSRADKIKFADQPSNLAQAKKDHQQVVVWVNKLTANMETEVKD